MKKILLLMSVAGALLVSSCSSGGNGSSDNGQESTSGSAKSEKASKGDSKIGNCLEKFDHDYAKMLTLDDIVSLHQINAEDVETDVSSTHGQYGSVAYSWMSDRPDLAIEILGQTIRGPDKNRIELQQLSFHDDASASTVDYFSRAYKKLSDEEIAVLTANLEKSYAGKPKELEQAKGFLEMRRHSKFIEVPDLGTIAYWKWDDTYGGELVTLVGKAQFAVMAKVSDNSDADLEAAKKLANEVINKCN